MPNPEVLVSSLTEIHPDEFPAYLGLEHQEKVQRAMASILKRLQVLYVKDEMLSTKGFFEALDNHVKTDDPSAKVYIGGGVVRSLLSYIYKKTYNEHQRQAVYSSKNTELVLERIIRGASRKVTGAQQDKELSSLQALGIGSDLDILVEYSSTIPEEKKAEIAHKTVSFINSAESYLKLRYAKDNTLKKSLIPIGDVKEYQPQIKRASSQGGSALDWLAFPITDRSGSVIRMPDEYPYIMDNFFQGQVDYLPGESNATEKQTVRGLRPLLELPFLKLTERGKQQLMRELNVLLAKINSGEALSPAAHEQFDKMVRNARFGGAHNRFASPRSDDEIAKLVQRISLLAVKGDKLMPLVPEFMLLEKIETRQLKSVALEVANCLMPLAEFKEQWTDHGILYHGTPKFEYLLTMIRNGLMPSIPDKQGAAAFGSGFYMTNDKSTARGYSSIIGDVFELLVNPSKNLRVLSLPNFIIQYRKLYLAAELEAKNKNKNINQYLAEKYQLDIIVNTYPLIMNPAAIQVPKKAADLIFTKLSGITTPNTIQEICLFIEAETYPELLSIHQLGVVTGIKNLPDVPSIEECQEKILAMLALIPLTQRLEAVKPIRSLTCYSLLVKNGSGPDWIKAILEFLLPHQRLDFILQKSKGINILMQTSLSPELLKTILELIPQKQRLEALKFIHNKWTSSTKGEASLEGLGLKDILALIPEEQRIDLVSLKNQYNKSLLSFKNPEDLKTILAFVSHKHLIDAIEQVNQYGYNVLMSSTSNPECLKIFLELYPSPAERFNTVKKYKLIIYAAGNLDSLKIILKFYSKEELSDALKQQDKGISVLDYAGMSHDCLKIILELYSPDELVDILQKKGDLLKKVAENLDCIKTLLTRTPESQLLCIVNSLLNECDLRPEHLSTILGFIPLNQRIGAVEQKYNDDTSVLKKYAVYPDCLKLLLNLYPTQEQRLDAVIKNKCLMYANVGSQKIILELYPPEQLSEALKQTSSSGGSIFRSIASDLDYLEVIFARIPKEELMSLVFDIDEHYLSLLEQCAENVTMDSSNSCLTTILELYPPDQRLGAISRANGWVLHCIAECPKLLKSILLLLPIEDVHKASIKYPEIVTEVIISDLAQDRKKTNTTESFYKLFFCARAEYDDGEEPNSRMNPK